MFVSLGILRVFAWLTWCTGEYFLSTSDAVCGLCDAQELLVRPANACQLSAACPLSTEVQVLCASLIYPC